MNKILKNMAWLFSIGTMLFSCGNSSLTGTNSGSLVEDRSSDVVMTFMMLFVVLILAISLIFVVSKKIVAYKNSPEHLERQKRRPTSASDIADIAKEASLTKKEKDLLWRICKTRKTPNVIYFVKDTDDVDRLLKEEYIDMKPSKNEDMISTLFSLRIKLLKTFKPVTVLRSTKVIEENSICQRNSQKSHWCTRTGISFLTR